MKRTVFLCPAVLSLSLLLPPVQAAALGRDALDRALSLVEDVTVRMQGAVVDWARPQEGDISLKEEGPSPEEGISEGFTEGPDSGAGIFAAAYAARPGLTSAATAFALFGMLVVVLSIVLAAVCAFPKGAAWARSRARRCCGLPEEGREDKPTNNDVNHGNN